MAINGISTQQGFGGFPQCGCILQRGAVDRERVKRHQRGGEQGHHACGAHGDGTGQPGLHLCFTPYHDHNGNKMSIWKAARRPESFPICRLNSSSSNPYAPEGA